MKLSREKDEISAAENLNIVLHQKYTFCFFSAFS
jgi:hypothetical protein